MSVCWRRRRSLDVQARDPKDEQIRIKEREAKRKMKGISLQYTEDDRVFFSDVAGIGDAKARHQRDGSQRARKHLREESTLRLCTQQDCRQISIVKPTLHRPRMLVLTLHNFFVWPRF